MGHIVKHLSLHRIAGTELRIVADVEAGVLPVIQVEETVIRGYTQQEVWPHHWVTLFVLQDLQPLVRQLTSTPSLPLGGGGLALPPGGAMALNYRPVVNVYDLADPAGCHIFVNRQAMAKESCWDDALAIQGLLAHEHAHPLAENETTRASRQLRVVLSPADSGWQMADSSHWPSAKGHQPSVIGYQPRVHRLLTLLAEKLCLYAPRELFANEVTITGGFGGALLHLDRRAVAHASHGVAGRGELRRQLQQEVGSGNLTPQEADLLLLIADLKGYLDLALEVAPFYRTGRESDARELEATLEAEAFPHLEPQVAQAYTALREQYIALRANLTEPELMAWAKGVLHILAEALAEKGLALQYSLEILTMDKRDA